MHEVAIWGFCKVNSSRQTGEETKIQSITEKAGRFLFFPPPVSWPQGSAKLRSGCRGAHRESSGRGPFLLPQEQEKGFLSWDSGGKSFVLLFLFPFSGAPAPRQFWGDKIGSWACRRLKSWGRRNFSPNGGAVIPRKRNQPLLFLLGHLAKSQVRA